MEIWIFGMGGFSGTSDLDLGKKVGNLDFWDGGYSGTSDLDLGKKVGDWIWGGVFWNFGFGLRKKSWKFGFLGWGRVFWNLGFGLRKKSWKFGFLGWGGILELWIWT